MHMSFAKYVLRLIAVTAITIAAGQAVADTGAAQQFFENGNTSFRQGDFESALANYSDAMANGKEGARLFYNMGLAHHRLGQYPQAEWAFREASKDRNLAALSYYQLGVLARRSDNPTAAADWFARTRASAKSDKLRRRASRALGIVEVPQPVFESSASVGFGFDSNAFRAPASSYIDLTQPVPTLVNPNEQSGVYVPASIRLNYTNPLSEISNLVAAYRFRGDFHADSELRNADESSHRLTVGGERLIGDGGSDNRKIEIAAVYRLHEETNFDRDDGLDRFDDGQSIADRFNYRSLGIEGGLKNTIGSSRVELDGGWEQRNYDDLPTASSYDLTAYWFGGAVKTPVLNDSRIKIAYEYYVRDFDERRSRDSNGNASLANSTIRYDYHNFEVGLKSRHGERFLTELIYFYTIRNDDFSGYNDYTKQKFRLRAAFDFSDRLRASVRLTYRDQDYSNAFAFDDPSQASKEYQEFEVVAAAQYRLNDRLSIRADIRSELVDSSDPRGEYDRTRVEIGASWQF